MSIHSTLRAHEEACALQKVPEFRQQVLELFTDSLWSQFATARMDAFHAKQEGRTFCHPKFPSLSWASYTNPYRMFDRGSQYVINNIANSVMGWRGKMLSLYLYRQFNLPSTYELFCDAVLAPTMDAKDAESLDALIEDREVLDLLSDSFIRYHKVCEADGTKLYSRAYLRNGGAAYTRYFEIMPEVLEELFALDGEEGLTIQEVFCRIRKYEGFGDFLAYQLALDINYCLDTSMPVDFVVPGPGAIKGLEYACGPLLPALKIATIKVLAEPTIQGIVLDDFKRVEGDWVGKDGQRVTSYRLLEENDVQNLFCEFSKMYRIDVLGDRPKRGYTPGLTPPMRLSIPFGSFAHDYGGSD